MLTKSHNDTKPLLQTWWYAMRGVERGGRKQGICPSVEFWKRIKIVKIKGNIPNNKRL
jgi:hypothetical protein